MPLSDPAELEMSSHSSLDMGHLLLSAYEIGDMVNQSAEVAEYAYWKSVVDQDERVHQLVKQFAKAKEQFADCERFGRFHPDYHAAKDKVVAIEQQLNEIESVSRFKAAEQQVDDLLHEIAKQIASSVSETIKVPSNDPLPKGGGCGSGGSCSCGSGGCG
ncbi:YlbF family regulator [Paenibacillus montanisoli]|uniref:YlbF family regulator n=1 Tax=Paenibacillus montanisoli TaxID=2081970 RepID=A0A328U754_9BACL|nr:YlbF family regulator [Paenibacillus montanisoli]RAP78698.1 YlbF family regulator [Paenibacillus montanisoli]